MEPKSLFCGIKTRALYAAVCCMPVEHVCKGEEEKWLWIKLFFLWSQNTDSYVFWMGYTIRAFRKRYCKRHWCNCKLPEGQSYITCRMCQNKETNRRFKTRTTRNNIISRWYPNQVCTISTCLTTTGDTSVRRAPVSDPSLPAVWPLHTVTTFKAQHFVSTKLNFNITPSFHWIVLFKSIGSSKYLIVVFLRILIFTR